MPRRHKPQKNAAQPQALSRESHKVSYPTKRDAERAAAETAKYNLDLILRPYQSPTNGLWYLTSTESAQTD